MLPLPKLNVEGSSPFTRFSALRSTSEVSGDFGLAVTRWILSDAGSSNGTRVGHEKIEGNIQLQDGDVIGLGRTSVVYLADDPESPDACRARCLELGIHSDDIATGIPLEDTSRRGTLTDE